jgi:hypothetical protein
MRKSMLAIALLCSVCCSAQVHNYYSPVTFLTSTHGRIWDGCNGCPNIFEINNQALVVHYVYGIPENNTDLQDLSNDGNDIWATSNTGIYFKISSTTWLATSYTALDYPSSIAFDGTNIWIVNHTTISKIDIVTGAYYLFN